jgi:hypothetical protein
MNRRTALLTLAALPVAAAAPVPRQFLPIVRQQGAYSIVPLIESDTTFISAVNVPGTTRVLLSYIDRGHGNRLVVVEDVGDHVENIPLPPIALAGLALAPAFSPPGPKQADGFLLIVGGELRLYYSSRAEDDPSGPFWLWRLTMAVPPPV